MTAARGGSLGQHAPHRPEDLIPEEKGKGLLLLDLGYAPGVLTDLLACPFCRDLYPPGEAKVCPTCGLPLAPMSKLPLSYEAAVEEEWQEKPEWVTLGWTFWRRGRGALVLAGVLGFGLFFAPWVHVTSPEIATLSGVDMARALGWIWACPVAWAMLVTTAASRRSVAKMRGARVVAVLFSAMPLITIGVLLLTPPSSGLVPVRFEYAWPFYATAGLGLLGIPFGFLFGGSLRDLPAPHGTSHGETLH